MIGRVRDRGPRSPQVSRCVIGPPSSSPPPLCRTRCAEKAGALSLNSAPAFLRARDLRSAVRERSKPVIEHCPTCGAETREGARFCYQCGAALRSDASSVPALAGATASTAVPMPLASSPVMAPPTAYPLPPPPPQGAPFFPQSQPPYPLVPRTPFSQRSGMATAGFWLGLATVIVGIALTWLGTIMGLCGLIFSLIGLRETGPRARLPGGPRTGRGLAIAGAVLSVIGMIGSVVLLVYILQNADRFGIQLPRAIGR